MKVNVAFDLMDNTDDKEPEITPNRDMMLLGNGQSS